MIIKMITKEDAQSNIKKYEEIAIENDREQIEKELCNIFEDIDIISKNGDKYLYYPFQRKKSFLGLSPIILKNNSRRYIFKTLKDNYRFDVTPSWENALVSIKALNIYLE